MNEANLQSVWSALLFSSLADAGIRDVVISPGSRSTPLVVAAVREPRITRHTAIDERAAAFFALGQARVTRRPSVLVCTSGTAPAHYLPALIEANITGAPIIVLSADRPHELYECRAPQTIDQVKLFGAHVRHFVDLVADGSELSLRALRRTVAQAVLTSTWPNAGAVHINARARKPLEPVAAVHPDEVQLAERARAIAADPIVVAPAPRVVAARAAVDAAAAVIRSGKRGVIVAGPAGVSQRANRDAVWALAETTGFAVACEATSQLRFAPKPARVHFVDGFALLFRAKAALASAPFDVAIQIGPPLTSLAWEMLAPSVARVVVAEQGWPDPQNSARAMVLGDIGDSVAMLEASLRDAPPQPAPGFHEHLRAMNDAAWAAVEQELANGELTEAAAVRALVERAPERSLLMIGNSLAIRLVDIYSRAMPRDIEVLSQRGASGIDGLVAGAAGAASAAERPLALVIGDVSLLHDLTSLALAARSRTPLIVFLLNNGGGRIFEELPIVDVPNIEQAIVEHATTPHETDFASAASLFGLRHRRPVSIAALRADVDEAYANPGCTLIEVPVAPNAATTLSRRVRASIDSAVAPLLRGVKT